MEQLAQGNGHGPRLLEFEECLDTALSHRVWILGGAVWSQGLHSVILAGPFQLKIFCGFMTNRITELGTLMGAPEF